MINSLLGGFLAENDPDPDIIKQATESQKRLREILASKLEKDDTLPSVLDGEDFLYGSAIRGTKPLPFDDIDLMLVLDGSALVAREAGQNVGPAHGSGKTYNPLLLPQYLDENSDISSKKILTRIYSVLSETYSRSEIKKDGQAVNVWMDSYGFGIDVVPAFKIDHVRFGTHYFIPMGGDSHMWQSTNPWSDIYAFNVENARLDGLLSKTCRLMRKWNQLSNASRLSGFHVDALVYHSLFGKNITTLENAIQACFDSFGSLLFSHCPQFSGFTPHIDHKLKEEHRIASTAKLMSAKNELTPLKLRLPINTTDRIRDTWNKIFNGELCN